ncbi:MAG TPA: hypothetical protein DGG94_12520 [Micromonosporaceae bacterium]|nr:hypothetical protein [Micromonosporaceae bacterium]HCU50605.1 hypothetical protein [Micromonosporaceae bacterium]
MIEVREASPGEAQSWLDGWRERLQAWYGGCSGETQWVSQKVERRLTRWHEALGRHLFTVVAAGEPVGRLALAEVDDPQAMLLADLWISPQHRQRGYGREAVQWAIAFATERADQITMVTADDPAHDTVFGLFPVRAQIMMKALTPAIEQPEGVTGRPMTAHEFATWREEQVVGYASDIAGSGLMSEAEARERSETQIDELLPDGVHTPGHTFLCIEAEGEVVATNWLKHEYAPGTSFVFGVEVVSGNRGKGYGKAAMLLGEQVCLEAGDNQLGLNVFGQNSVAIGLYHKLDYVTVEKFRSLALTADH